MASVRWQVNVCMIRELQCFWCLVGWVVLYKYDTSCVLFSSDDDKRLLHSLALDLSSGPSLLPSECLFPLTNYLS